MLHNYLKTTIRHIRRNKVNFAFKLGGLALALCSLLIIVLYVYYQLSFDKFHQGYENIFRVNSNRDEDGKITRYAMIPPAIGPAMKEAFPEILAYARTGVSNRVMIRYQDKLFRFTGFVEADSSIFDVLAFTFLRGDKTALQAPGSIVLTESLARQIFGDEDPLDKIITSPDHQERPFHVKAIVKDFPTSSHLVVNAIHSFGALLDTNSDSWEITWDGSVNLYVRLSPDADPVELARRTLPLLKKNLVKLEDGSDKKFSIFLQPIASIYLGPELKMEFNKKGNVQYVYIFSLLGFFLLIIACINYINLSIADFDTRTREIGVRKILGARKSQIGSQVVFESFIISITALIIGIALLYFLFPMVAAGLDQGIRFEMLFGKRVMILIFVIILLLVLFSAGYPTYRLVLQNPSAELKSGSGYGNRMRAGKVLLFVQCIVSIVCICATVIVGQQISFVKKANVGYDRSSVVSLVMPDEYPSDRISVLKNEIGNIAGVESVSYSYYLMPISIYFKGWYQIERNGNMEKMLLNEMFVDHDYFKTMGIKIVEGRNFQKDLESDVHSSFIINETAARELGWDNPLGKRIKSGYLDETRSGEGTVIGVVKDFHTLSLHRKIEPVIMRLQYDRWPGNALNVRIPGQLSEALPLIVDTYEKLMPGFLADVRIVEDLFNRQYQNEDKAFASLQIGTIIIILISGLGVFSLSLYMSVKRMKEFGIRKVLGATMIQIISLHVRYFIRIVIIANLVALPVAYWLMDEWLSNFAYRTTISGLVLLVVIGSSFILVAVSGAYSAWKAGAMNPVEAIKIE